MVAQTIDFSLKQWKFDLLIISRTSSTLQSQCYYPEQSNWSEYTQKTQYTRRQ